MAAFVNRILPRAADEANPVAIRLLSGPQSRTSASTPLDARDSDRNHTIWNARLVLATTGLHLVNSSAGAGSTDSGLAHAKPRKEIRSLRSG